MKKKYEHKRRFGWDPELNLIIVKQLRAKRLELGITQAELAKRLGISQVTVWRIEDNEHNLTITKLDRYAEALGIDIVITFPINKKGVARISLIHES